MTTSPTATTPATAPSRWARIRQQMGRDAILHASGLPLSIIAMPVLLAVFLPGVALLPLWVGLLVLPAALQLAAAFADLSRARARAWGAAIPEVSRPAPAPGLSGWIVVAKEPRRWLDLLFETLFALPIRVLTFSISLSWFAGALGGLTYAVWGRALPDHNQTLLGLIVAAVSGDWDRRISFAADAAFEFVIGLVLLLTLPAVLRLMAVIEIAAIQAGLGSTGGTATPPTSPPQAPPATGPDGPAGPGHPGPPAQPPRTPTLRTPAAPGAMTRSTAAPAPGVSPVLPPLPTLLSPPTNGGPAPLYWLVTIFAGVVLLAVAWPVTAVIYGTWTVVAMLVAIAQSAAIVVAVRWPLAAIVLSGLGAGGVIAATANTTGMPWPWTVPSLLAVLVVHIVIGLLHRWPYLGALFTLTAVLSGVALLLPRDGGPAGASTSAIVAVSLSAGISILVLLIRMWIRNRGELASVRRLSEVELAKRQHLEERTRIARELHDVVAHSMSVISVQATTARYRNPQLDETSSEEFESIAGSARQALTEMRGLLSVLRDGQNADLAPQPGILDIPALVSATRDSGAEVALEFDEQLPVVAPTTGLTAFRIVQEGLANALRHAPGAVIAVSVRRQDGQLLVSVANGPAAAKPAADPHAAPALAAGGGFGLTGMHDRVQALGGTVSAGPAPAGGFKVAASLPIG